MDMLAWFMLAGLVLWLLLLASSLSRPTPKSGALEFRVPPDAMLVLSSPERMTAEEMQDISAKLSAALLNPRRPLVLIVPPGFRIEAVLRRCPTNSAGEPGTTQG